ncbi:unnamed protein product [Effrenium voratum]|uniref:Uncharacterized protein n=1 Tax=Effrenium voratum TaxID=2562239 RepID=A0AA36IZ64_9DINO|nr:unnamed protein product [Effrenium voratum]
MRSAFNDTLWAMPADGHIPLPDPLPLARRTSAELEALLAKRRAEEAVDMQNIPRQDWLEFTATPDTIAQTDLVSSDWVQKGPDCRTHDLDPLGQAAWYHPYFRFKQPAYAVHVQLAEMQRGKPRQKIWDVIFAGGEGSDKEVLRNAVPIGGNLPLFKEFCQPLAEDARWELRVTDVTPNKKGLPTKSFDETLLLRPKPNLPRTYHLRKKGLPAPKKFSADFWTRKEQKRQEVEKAERMMEGLAWPPRKPLTLGGDLAENGAIDFSSSVIDPEPRAQ